MWLLRRRKWLVLFIAITIVFSISVWLQEGNHPHEKPAIAKLIEVSTSITSVQINPSGDSFIRELFSDNNYGSFTYLVAGREGDNTGYLNVRNLVEFNLSSIPDGAIIVEATLNLYHYAYNGLSEQISIGAHRVINEWAELTVTWNNQPTHEIIATDSISFTNSDTGHWRTWDVTANIGSSALQGDWISWKLIHTGTPQSYCNFYSKEAAGYDPYLEINYTVLTLDSISADASLVDRDIDHAGSGADDVVRITIQATDIKGVSFLDNPSGIAFVTVKDPYNAVVVDAVDISSTYEQVSGTSARWHFDYNPNDLATVGLYDVYAEVHDEEGNVVTDSKLDLFTVNDLQVSLSIADSTPVYKIDASGIISRIYGATTADSVRVVDSNEGELTPSFGATTYSHSYGLVSPIRLHRGNLGELYAWARDDALDGVSSELSYQVEGDNATVTISSISNQVEQSVLGLTVKWASDSSNATGTCYVKVENIEAGISSGSGQLILDHLNWITSGLRTISFYDNADRPLWQVSEPSFTTKSLALEENLISVGEENAEVRIKVGYQDSSIGTTPKLRLMMNSEVQAEKQPDENGWISWVVELSDNLPSIELWLENVYDTRTDIVVNSSALEDLTLRFLWLQTTFELQIPSEPIVDEQAEIKILAINSTENILTKHCELQYDGHVTPIEIELQPQENKEISVWLDVADLKGTLYLTLYDLDEDRVLATGSITIEQSSSPPPPFPLMSILPFVALAIGVPLGVIGFLRATGRLKFGQPRELPELRPRGVAKIPIKVESEVGEDYLRLLMPAAKELAMKGPTSKQPRPTRIRSAKKPATGPKSKTRLRRR